MSEFDLFLCNMALDKTWGDELTLKAAADEFGVVIHIITSEKENWYLKVSRIPSSRSSDRDMTRILLALLSFGFEGSMNSTSSSYILVGLSGSTLRSTVRRRCVTSMSSSRTLVPYIIIRWRSAKNKDTGGGRSR